LTEPYLFSFINEVFPSHPLTSSWEVPHGETRQNVPVHLLMG
jgi:hypothetical protein